MHMQAAGVFLKQQTNELTEQGLQWASKLETDLAEKDRELETIRHNHQQAQTLLKVRLQLPLLGYAGTMQLAGYARPQSADNGQLPRPSACIWISHCTPI